MKQVNFKELNVEVGIDQYQNHDLRKEIGNALHRASESVPMSELARNIYYSEGDIKIPNDETHQAGLQKICIRQHCAFSNRSRNRN